jgi:hypothetical protein
VAEPLKWVSAKPILLPSNDDSSTTVGHSFLVSFLMNLTYQVALGSKLAAILSVFVGAVIVLRLQQLG